MTTRMSWVLGLGIGLVATVLGGVFFAVRGYLAFTDTRDQAVAILLAPTPEQIEQRKAAAELDVVRRQIADLKKQRDDRVKEWTRRLQNAQSKRDEAKFVWGSWQEKIRSEGAQRSVVEGLREAYANFLGASNAVVSARAEVDSHMQDSQELIALQAQEAELFKRAYPYQNSGPPFLSASDQR